MADRPTGEWNSELCDCFEDVSTCCYGFWCGPCLACTVSGKFGECYCLPLCDYCGPAVLALCGIPCFAPGAALGMRASMRNRYNIKGDIWKDIAVSCFCPWCSWCQMHREIKHQRKTPVVVNMTNQTVIMQPNPTVIMQPNPVMMVPAPMPQVSYMTQPGFVIN